MQNAAQDRFRVIANRPAANAPMVVRPEPEKPADAVNFLDTVALVFFALLALVGVWALCVLILALERVAS